MQYAADAAALSAALAYVEGGTEEMEKIIFVSDGNTAAYRHEMSQEDSWEHNQGSVVSFNHFVELCRKIKGEDIDIYMLNITGNPHAVDYFRQCATSPEHYYPVSEAADISTVFSDVLTGLKEELRILR